MDYALEIIRAVAAYHGLSDSTDLLVVSHELLKNAVVHGNRNDNARGVLYEMTHLGGGRYRLVTQDDGEGFDPRELAGGPGAPARELQAAGPLAAAGGLRLIHHLAQRVRFSRNGSRISVLMQL